MIEHAATVARKDADSRRVEIADAALKVIAEQGLGRFTALAIAREVGVSDAALFRHFPSKEAIVMAAVARVEELLVPRFPTVTGDPIARLGRFFEARVAVLQEHPGIARLVASDQLAHAVPEDGVERVLALRRRSATFVRSCLEEAAATGELRQGLEPDVATTLVLGAILALTQGPPQLEPPGPSLPARTWRALERTLRRHPAAEPGDRVNPAQPRRRP